MYSNIFAKTKSSRNCYSQIFRDLENIGGQKSYDTVPLNKKKYKKKIIFKKTKYKTKTNLKNFSVLFIFKHEFIFLCYMFIFAIASFQ